VWDTLIVGAGPSGLFTALRAGGSPESVLIVDGGRDIEERIQIRAAGNESRRNVTTGFGGAGMFSDGKLSLSPVVGSIVAQRFPREEVARRQRAIDEIFRDGRDAPLRGTDDQAVSVLKARARTNGLVYRHYPVRHVGTDLLPDLTARLRQRVAAVAAIACRTRCLDVRPCVDGEARWEVLVDGDYQGWLRAHNVVLAPGKVGATWLSELGARLGLSRNGADPKLGLRLEGPRGFLDPLLEVTADPKLIWRGTRGAEARTHCVCFGGDVVPTGYDGLTMVGGHSTAEHGEDRSNTAVIATGGEGLPLTADFARRFVAEVNERAGGRVLAQDVGSFLDGTPPSARNVPEFVSGFTPSMPFAPVGDLSSYFPAQITDLLRTFIRQLTTICPDAARAANIVYGPAVERFADEFSVTDEMEAVGASGLFLVGDGPGLTGGIIGAADSGWVCGNAVARRRAGKLEPKRVAPE
jgi:uncharacterized FAD-dependent dehydrogenase